MPNLSGQSIGRYHIIEPLGEGGMATVYKALDTSLEADVAIKLIRTAGLLPAMRVQALKRFEREAKSLARLTHPNIVKVTDYGDYEGQPFLAMEYLPGGTLQEHLGKSIPWNEAARVLLPIARALEFAHQQGIIHRDIKPSNILFTRSGEPMLTDFGVAKILDDSVSVELTGTSMSIGTPAYMAPEQARAKNVDGRADIYSLGIVYYEMVTGRKPFEADTPLAVLFKHASDPLPRPSQFVPDLPDAVEKVLFKALAKNPDDRYQTMGEFATALEKIATNDLSFVITEQEKVEYEVEDFKKTIFNKEPTVIANTSAALRKPVRSVRSLRLFILVGALIIVLGVTIPLGFRFLNPTSNGSGMFGGVVADTATLTSTSKIMPTFTPTHTVTPTATVTPSPTITLTPTLGIGSTWVRPADGMVMVYVPEGEFTMGSNIGLIEERPAHTVFLDAFWIDQTEVTNKMYALCIAAGKCAPMYTTVSATHPIYFGNPEYDDYPVTYMSWTTAFAYCAWAGGSTYDVHLPTEAEWEKAARGTDGRTYPWGEGIDCLKANTNRCVGDTSRVGRYEAGKSPYGAYDMAGNVYEFVADWYSETYYTSSPLSNPTGPTSGSYRVVRGGTWNWPESSARSTARLRDFLSNIPDLLNSTGFRCARSH